MNPYFYGQQPQSYPIGYGYQPMPSQNYINNNQNQQVQLQTQNAQQPMQFVFLPLTNVNSIEDVKRFIVPINQSVYFRLNNEDKIYLKSTDFKGVSSIEEFDLIKATEKKPSETNAQPNNYVTKEDFNALTMALSEFRSILLSEVKTLLNEPKKEVVNDVK